MINPPLLALSVLGIIATSPPLVDAQDVKATGDAHPPCTSKLFLEKYVVAVPRLVFMARLDDKSFQIDTPDISQPSQILQMGDVIAGTKFKIVGFVEKFDTTPRTLHTDISELTIQNTATNDKVVLVLGDTGRQSCAVFKYAGNGPTEIRVKLGAIFSLPPEPGVNYKLIDINADKAKILNLTTNQEIMISKEPTTSTAFKADATPAGKQGK